MRPINDDIEPIECHWSEARRLTGALEASERSFLRYVLSGHSLIQCAGRLGLTVEEAAHVKAGVMRKLSASQTADLVRVAVYAGLDPIP